MGNKIYFFIVILLVVIIGFVMKSNSSDETTLLNEGDKAPDFTALDDDGNAVSLSDFSGKNVVLYFYPKDDTPGCTKEACSFRDSFEKIKSTGAVLLGVSLDTQESHKKFIEKYKLPFPLLVDRNGEISKKYGAYIAYLRTIKISKRMTFIIDGSGLIKKIFREVDVSKHADDVYNELQSIAYKKTEVLNEQQ